MIACYIPQRKRVHIPGLSAHDHVGVTREPHDHTQLQTILRIHDSQFYISIKIQRTFSGEWSFSGLDYIVGVRLRDGIINNLQSRLAL